MKRASTLSLGWLLIVGTVASPAAQQPPQFRSSVEVTSVDVTVVDSGGRPATDLTPEDFSVRVNGESRRVLTATWVPLTPPPGASVPPPPPEGYSTNQTQTAGRVMVIAVDEPNIRAGNAGAVLRTVGDFVDRLQPADRVAAISLGIGGAATPFTGDKAALKRALALMPGQAQADSRLGYNIAISEALDIARDSSFGANFSLSTVATRECTGGGRDRQMCVAEIRAESMARAQAIREGTERTFSSLRQILTALKAIDAPKTLILVSGGLVVFDAESEILNLGSLAAAARTSVYVLSADDLITDPTAPRVAGAGASDRNLLFDGLDLLASASRGAVLRVTGNGSGVIAQVESELSGYYLLGLESDPSDKDGKAHPVNVNVSRRGFSVRSRRQTLAAADAAPSTTREEVTAGLMSPLVLSGLPLRVVTFSVREPETDKVQLVIHADVGSDYPAARPVSLAYVITDKSGRVIDTVSEDARLQPVMAGVPSPLQFVSTASLPPGDYGLKLSVVEGDRAGTVEHVFHAGLGEAGAVALSDLMVGGPARAGDDLLAPTVSYSVNFGTVQGYLEAYGAGIDAVSVKYEVAPSQDGEPLLTEDSTGKVAGRERRVFSSTLSVGRLPPGKYFLRAVVSAGSQPSKTLARAFEVAPPPVLMTSADSAVTASTTTDVYLPVADTAFRRAFRKEDAARGDALKMFRESVTPASREAFDKGASYLASGDYTNAEQSFKAAIRSDDQSSVALAFLAATYAASGHDNEAAGAWQTSLIDASGFPQIYEWLGDTLLRVHDLSGAKTVLEEAVGKWPADVRFAKPLALVYATFGQGVEAVRMLERHLSVHADDVEALGLGVEWIYHLHSAGVAASTPTDDLGLAKRWADAYLKAKGPQSALVNQWMAALR